MATSFVWLQPEVYIATFAIFPTFISVIEWNSRLKYYQMFVRTGLLDPLLKELDNYADPLSCLAAWSLFREIACGSLQRLENKADVTAAACRILSSRVLTMLSESDDVALICGMLSVAAPIISAGLATCDEGNRFAVM